MVSSIIKKEPVTISEIKEILKDKELTDFRSQKTYQYVQEFSKLSVEKVNELKSKLKELNILRLNEEIIVKIVDIMPKSEGELKAILQGFNVTLPKDQLKTILNTIVEFL